MEKILSNSTERFRRGIIFCCINFGYRKILEKRWGVYQDFTSKLSCLTVPKISVGNTLLLHYFRVPKKFGEEGGSIKIFRRKFFVSQCRKFSQGNPLVFTNFGNRKILWLRGLFHDLLMIFLCLTVPKNFAGEPFCAVFQNFSGSEKIYG